MGQKTHPVGLRLGINRSWDSKWFTSKHTAEWLEEDIKLRRYIKKRLARAGVSKIVVERRGGKVKIHIHTARPGMVIGRKGAEVDFLSEELAHLTNKEVNIDIKEVKKPELNAQLVAEHIAGQLEQRVSFRRAMKKAIGSAMRMGGDVEDGRLHGWAGSPAHPPRQHRLCQSDGLYDIRHSRREDLDLPRRDIPQGFQASAQRVRD